MANEIELVSDGDGVLVAGDSSAVARFLGHVGLLDQAHEVDLARINTIAKTGADAFATVSAIVEQSAMDEAMVSSPLKSPASASHAFR